MSKLSDSLFSFAAAGAALEEVAGAEPKAKPKQGEPDLLSELLNEDAKNAGAGHNNKRATPQDHFWERKFKTAQPQGPEKTAAPAEQGELDVDLNAPHMAGFAPPKHGHPAQQPTAAGNNYQDSVQVPRPSSPQQQLPQQAGDYRDSAGPVPRSQYVPPPAVLPPPQDQSYAPAEQQQQARYPTTPVNAPLCPGCTAPLEVGSRFCGECGYQLQTRIPACHLCGAPLEPSAKFCGECGSKCLDATAQAPAESEKPTQRTWVNKLSKFMDE
jgi:hypothetical protein